MFKKKELLIISILSFLYFSFLSNSKIFAIDLPRVDEKAYRLCEGTGGEVVEGTKGRFEGFGPYRDFPVLFVDCACPDRTKQSLFVGTEGLEEWQGCKAATLNQLIAFRVKIFLQKYYQLILFWLLFLAGIWWVLKKVKKKK